MNEKSIIIIGAGVAGLSAGCYARMNGYNVRIFEQDSRPGGLCTSWERSGYTIHGNMAFLGGSGPGTPFHKIWEELGVIPKVRMIDYDYFAVFEGRDRKTFFAHTDIDRLEKHMKELAPEDRKQIDEFITGVRTFARYDMPIEKAPELLGPADMLRLILTRLPLLRALNRWKKITIKDFAHRFKNPLLRDSFLEFRLMFTDELPVAIILMALAWSHQNSCGYPVGGAVPFVLAIEDRLAGLGGKILYNTRISKILVKDGKAVGIRSEDGTEHFAETIISAADGGRTIFDWLEGRYVNDKIRGYYERLPVTTAGLLVSIGVNKTFLEIPTSAAGFIYWLDEPALIGGREYTSLRPMIYNFDPTLAPPGKTLMRVLLPTDYEYWNSLGRTSERYKAEKEAAARTVISLLDHRYPGLASCVEMWDVATPLTFEHYTGNRRGSSIGWDITSRTFMMPMSKTLPRLKDFYLAGQWVVPGGGLPMVALSGRNVIQLICRRDKKAFSTTV
ncbi:MAG TPA: NAD(P)/FAD-dependent oxidoreductase [Candidatus Desulfaltia sp.]|nr:NAD(P)/FAD-dependent oxidoreductase [Candidatus Desulfaltia sp.]